MTYCCHCSPEDDITHSLGGSSHRNTSPFVCTSYCMSARAICQILASSPRAAGPRASANIMTYSPRTHAITSLLHDTGIVVSAIYYKLA